MQTVKTAKTVQEAYKIAREHATATVAVLPAENGWTVTIKEN